MNLDPVHKTLALLVFVHFDNTMQQVGSKLCGSKPLGPRLEQIDKWTQECFDFCKGDEPGPVRPLSIRARRIIDGFGQLFAKESADLLRGEPYPGLNHSEAECAIEFSEVANTLLYDLAVYVPEFKHAKCLRWLKHHSNALNADCWGIIPQERRESAQMLATDMYMRVADFLEPANLYLLMGESKL